MQKLLVRENDYSEGRDMVFAFDDAAIAASYIAMSNADIANTVYSNLPGAEAVTEAALLEDYEDLSAMELETLRPVDEQVALLYKRWRELGGEDSEAALECFNSWRANNYVLGLEVEE